MGLRVILFLLLATSAPAAELTFDSLAATIRAKHLSSVEAVLNEIPAEYWQHYALVRESHSRQIATPAQPRVLLYGNDAHLVIGFSGAANTLEMIQYREAERRYEFREVAFKDGEAHVSDANPHQCRTCHQGILRPNWSDYPDWPGTYGSTDDTLSGDERTQYLAFVKSAPRLARYAKLQRPGRGEIAPYSEERFGRFDERPNLYFTKLLTRRHARTVAHLLLADRQGDARLRAGMTAIGCPESETNNALEKLLRAASLAPSDFEIFFREEPRPWPTDLSSIPGYFDGLFQLDELVRYAVASELVESYPDARAALKERPYAYDPTRLTDKISSMLATVNGLGGALANPIEPLCEALRGRLSSAN